MSELAAMLGGGDRRSIAGADAAARAVLAQPGKVHELWTLLQSPDPLLRMRAADALEKASRKRPDLLAPHKAALLGGEVDDGTKEVRWHLLALCARLELDGKEAATLFGALEQAFREDDSRIVQVMALQAAAELAAQHDALQPRFRAMLKRAAASPHASLAARARKLSRTSAKGNAA